LPSYRVQATPVSGAPAHPAAGGGCGGHELEAENRELRKRTKQLEQENEILRRATAYFARDTLPNHHDAQPVAAGARVLLQQTLRHQRREQAVHPGLAEPRQLRDPDRLLP
jgi:hypothetical protein